MLVNAVEFLIAKDDRTWDTVILDVPASCELETAALIDWAETNVAHEPRFKNVVLWGVYWIPPNDGDNEIVEQLCSSDGTVISQKIDGRWEDVP